VVVVTTLELPLLKPPAPVTAVVVDMLLPPAPVGKPPVVTGPPAVIALELDPGPELTELDVPGPVLVEPTVLPVELVLLEPAAVVAVLPPAPAISISSKGVRAPQLAATSAAAPKARMTNGLMMNDSVLRAPSETRQQKDTTFCEGSDNIPRCRCPKLREPAKFFARRSVAHAEGASEWASYPPWALCMPGTCSWRAKPKHEHRSRRSPSS
jgi:hypothetical protein